MYPIILMLKYREKRESRWDAAMRCVFRANAMKNSNVVQKLSTISKFYKDYNILEVENVITDGYSSDRLSRNLAAIIGADAELFTLGGAQYAPIKYLKT